MGGADREEKASELKVFITGREATCGECKEELGRQAWIMLAGERGAVCLACADLDQLEFLPPGNAALTRRARKYSTLSAVVLKWSKSRKRYERQGLLVESPGIERAELECLADAEVRARKREREGERRSELDAAYVEQFAKRVRALYPRSPAGREREIAEHACMKYSGRIGRSAAAKAFDDDAVRLAVAAHVRHRETDYDTLLANGMERIDARAVVRPDVDHVLQQWGPL